MQHIATDKSEFAALSFKVGTQKSQNINPQVDFQSFLREANPIYSQPVQPRVAVDRVSEPSNPSANNASSRQKQDVKGSDLYDRKQTPQQTEQQVKAKNTTPAVSQSNSNTAQVQQGKSAQQSKSVDAAVENDNLSADKSAADKAAAHNTTSKAEDNEQTGTNNQQPSTSKESELTATGVETKDTDITAHTSEDAAGEETAAEMQSDIDWLTLVESSLRADLANNTDKSAKPALKDSEIKLSADITGELGSKANGLDAQLAADAAQTLSIEKPVTDAGTDQTLLVTEEQIAADFATQKEQSALATLADLLNKPGAAKPPIAKIEEAIEELLLAQNSALRGKNTENVENAGQQHSLLTAVPADILVDAKSANNAMTEAETSLDAELLVAMTLPEKLAGNQNQVVQTTNVKADTTTIAADILPAGLTENLPEQSANTIAEDLTRLAKLPDTKLDAALANMADRLVSDADKNRNNAVLQSLEKVTLGADPAVFKENFVAALKAGIEEFKAQLQQGHQPSIDLNAMVADSLTKITGVQVNSEQVSGTLSRFNQTLEVSNLLRAQNDSGQLSANITKVTSNDTLTQAQVTQQKQGQQVAQFDKAVNITRNEGLQQMAEKVRWMVNQNNLQAEIRLDPPDLGAMKVRINMAGDSATVSIVVQSQQARDVLEQATPRLKELLEQQGIELGQSSVHQEQGDTDAEAQGQLAGGHSEQQELEDEDMMHIDQPIRNGRLGGIDYFV
ncbi:flagellar hook-length control protein FliK [Aliiglaciecola litoralis]|uniref:Flagellar hook-length control protein FliK n=1 Tax=Aliiglaciecola litoralis TaxID=582857 RepID=A0ABP3WQX0_9ALTE